MYSDKGFTTLDEIVRKSIADDQLTVLHSYIWRLHYAIDGLRKCMYNLYPISKELPAKMPLNKMIKYPIDCVGVIRVGFQNGDRFETIPPDSSIIRKDEDDLSYTTKQSLNPASNPNPDAESLFTMVQGYNKIGYYRDNKQERRIEFSTDCALSDVIIDYMGATQAPNTRTEVPVVALDYIVQFIKYRMIKWKRGAAHTETEMERRSLDREAAELRKNISNLTMDGIVQAKQRQMMLTPKY